MTYNNTLLDQKYDRVGRGWLKTNIFSSLSYRSQGWVCIYYMYRLHTFISTNNCVFKTGQFENFPTWIYVTIASPTKWTAMLLFVASALTSLRHSSCLHIATNCQFSPAHLSSSSRVSYASGGESRLSVAFISKATGEVCIAVTSDCISA